MNSKITMLLNDREHTIELIDSAMSRQFVEMLPFDAFVAAYAGSHYWGSIPRKISTPQDLKTSTPFKGGLYYADHLTALAVYFDDPGSIAPYVVYHLGSVVDDLS